MTDKVMVDFNVPVGLPVHLVLLADLNTFHQTQEGGAVKFFKLGIVPDQVQPAVGGAFVLSVSLQLLPTGQKNPLIFVVTDLSSPL